MIGEIGKDNYGLYSLVVVFISYFLLDFGLGSTISTYVSNAKAKEDLVRVKNIISVCYKVYFIITIIVCVCLMCSYFFLDEIFKSFTPVQLHSFKIIYLIAGLFSLVTFPLMPLNGILVAYSKFVFLKLADLSCKVTCIVLIVVCLLSDLGLYALVAVNSACTFVVALVKLIYVKKHLNIGFEFSRKLEKHLLVEISKFSGWVFIISIAQRLIINIEPAVLGVFSGAEQIAVFSIGVALEGYIWTVGNCLNGLFIPKVSTYVAKGISREEITDTMIRVGRIQLYLVGVIICGFVALGSPFLELWLGKSFASSYYVAILLILPNIIIIPQEIATTLMWVENKVKMRAIIYIITGFVSCTLGVVLSQNYGAIGCGIAIFIALLGSIVAMNYVYSHYLHLNIIRFFKECHLKILPVLMIPVMVILIFNQSYAVRSWYSFMAYAVLYIIVEFVLLFLLCFNHSERKLLKF